MIKSWARVSGLLLSLCVASTYGDDTKASEWKEFVQVAGQPEPVPAQWVATPEGKLAHSIVIPNPVPKDSGYRWWMSSKKYFEHLCNTEAGEFIFKTVENVEGFLFMRPPNWPTDEDLMNRYKLEAPEIERTFQLRPAKPVDRAKIFVGPPWSLYGFIEEPIQGGGTGQERFVRLSGFVHNKKPMQVVAVSEPSSRYGLIWRGVKRKKDRENTIAGSEWIVIDLGSKEILAVQRNFAMTGRTANTPEGIWWLNAKDCPQLRVSKITSRRFYEFSKKSMSPKPIAKP